MKENSESHQKELFARYLNDECTHEELTQLFAYLQQSDDRQEYQEVLEDLWKRLSAYQPMHPGRADEIFRQVVSEPVNLKERKNISKQAGQQRAFHWRKIAAVFIGLLIVSVFAYQYLLKPDTLTFSTAYGETLEIWLPDSSKVILNGNSFLTYPAHWEAESREAAGREVWLEGEAYFEVREIRHKADANGNTPSNLVKFTVHTPHLNVEVLGTAFDVHNRDDKTQVVLNSGKVKLNLLQKNQQEEIVMQPGEMVAFDARESRVEQKMVNPEHYSSWKDQRLVFVDTPVSEIVQILEERYGFKIRLTDREIAARKFTGTVSTEQIDLLLKAMGSSFNLKITQKGKQITMQYQ